jgi:predicted RNA binding protein YcfA (HicA-like mRNA interferase family)
MGWDVELTRGNHLVCTHPQTGKKVFCSATPSDSNWKQRVTDDMRRALRVK